MKKITIIIVISFASFIFADFSKDANGIVDDNITKLSWQDNYSDNGGAVKEASSWEDAINYCENLDLNGTNWRLPNKNEFFSIIDYTKYNPTIDGNFTETKNNIYWSSTTGKNFSDAWAIDFKVGNIYYLAKNNSAYVRCVRTK